MPGARKKPNKGSAFLERDKYTAELSSGQLVFGISILLVFGLTCFLLGILVGRFEPSQTPFVNAALTDDAGNVTTPQADPEPERRTFIAVDAPASPAKKAEREDKTEGRQVSPRTVPLAVAKKANDSKADDASATSKPRDLSGPRHVNLGDASETSSKTNGSAKPSEAMTVVASKPSEDKAERPTKASERSTSTAPASVESSTPVVSPPAKTAKPRVERTKVAEAIEPLEPDVPRSTRPKPEARVAAPGSAPFSIQMAAMRKESNAASLQSSIRSRVSYPVAVVAVESRGLSLVLVGAFDTRSEAQSALRELRRTFPEFSDTFIRTRK